MGIGGMISLDKVKKKQFVEYDGLFSYALDDHTNLESSMIPKGNYLCGYQKRKIGEVTKLISSHAFLCESNHLILSGYAYEVGLNEFVIVSEKEYITKIMIKIKE